MFIYLFIHGYDYGCPGREAPRRDGAVRPDSGREEIDEVSTNVVTSFVVF